LYEVILFTLLYWSTLTKRNKKVEEEIRARQKKQGKRMVEPDKMLDDVVKRALVGRWKELDPFFKSRNSRFLFIYFFGNKENIKN